jgi:hypothetical protein
LILIVTPGFVFEWVWWQIVTFPVAGTVVAVVPVVVAAVGFLELPASAFATMTPATSSKAIAAPEPKTARARRPSKRLSSMFPLVGLRCRTVDAAIEGNLRPAS